MAASFDLKNISWDDILRIIDQVIAALEGNDRDNPRAFFEALAAKKTADRRTWGRMSLLAQDALGKFDDSDNRRVREILLALRAIVIVAMDPGK